MDSIVSIGVGRNPEDPRRMLAIAAGKHYSNLNTTQCTFTFEPLLFKIDVGIRNRTVAVTPLHPVSEFYPGSANLTHTLMRQFELISNVQTTLYVSILGNAFNRSINDYIYN
ncbi:hypothetical protein, partial [Acinetobacter baumannii]|uniref:hypothetical protein n=1 Tax=Acinetobacter baumannii TaxID=470 RepID=UPI001A7EDADE